MVVVAVLGDRRRQVMAHALPPALAMLLQDAQEQVTLGQLQVLESNLSSLAATEHVLSLHADLHDSYIQVCPTKQTTQGCSTPLFGARSILCGTSIPCLVYTESVGRSCSSLFLFLSPFLLLLQGPNW